MNGPAVFHGIHISELKRRISELARENLATENAELLAALKAMADLARTTTRPSGCPDVCRALLDIEGIARAAISKAESTN